MIALVVWVLAVSGWRIGRAWALIAAGLLVFSVSDCLYLFQTAGGSYVAGGATDLGWVGGCVLLAWAAWTLDRTLVRALCVAWLLTASLHLLFHAGHLDRFGSADAVAEIVSLALLLVPPPVAIWGVARTDT